MQRRHLLTLPAVLVMTGLLSTQQVGPIGVPAATTAKHGLPGTKPGTERWLVQFKTRSFDLEAFRRANLAGDAARVNSIVSVLERKVRADQRPFVEAVEKLGGRVVEQWWIVNACCIEVPFAQLDAVRRLPNVLRLEPDEVVEPLIKRATSAANHNSDAANASGFKGLGVATAIVDTGLDASSGSRGRPHRIFYPEGDLSKAHRLKANKQMGILPPDNAHPHGTGVAGICAGGRWTTANGDNGHAPLADIVGYSLSNNSAGSTTFTVLVKAWQTVAADAVRFKIKTANNSYSGTPDPTHVSQQALDSAAFNADVMIVVAAGNFGSSTRSSQSCANGLAVAATTPNTHKIASFSSRGPLSGDTQRFYPDISGNGVGTIMPRVDNEGSDWTASGTSMASPQVCGAATLIRSQDTQMKAVEAKAVLLAAALDISAKNPSLNRNAYGLGLSKDDNATNLVKSGNYGRASVTAAQTTWTKVLPTVAGKSYRVAVAWMRHVNLALKSWSNLDIEVRRGSTVVARGNTPRNLYEFAGFRSLGGAYILRVTATTLEGGKPQEFGWAFTEGQLPPVAGDYKTFGQGCPGTGLKPAGGPISPSPYASKWGESANYFPHGRANMRYQQLHNASEFSQAFLITGIAFRLDERFGGPAGQKNIQYLLGYASTSASTMSTTFASNYKGTMTSVFKGVIKWPQHSGGNRNLKSFAVQVKFTRPWPYSPQKGNLLWEAINTSTTSTLHFFDWARASGIPVRRVWAFSTTATRGSRDRSTAGLVTQFLTPGGPGAVPTLGASGVPDIGKSFDVTLANAKPSTAAGLITGGSRTKWGAFNLPLSLTPFGASGCFLNVSFDSVIGVATGSTGAAKVTFVVPNDKALISAQFHNQFLVLDKPQGNSLGIVWSNGGTATVGGQP